MTAVERAAEVLAEAIRRDNCHGLLRAAIAAASAAGAEALAAAGLLAEPTDQGEDFRSRLVAAAAELESMADISGLAESSRLSGKAEGVRLALSYWDETTRAPDPSP